MAERAVVCTAAAGIFGSRAHAVVAVSHGAAAQVAELGCKADCTVIHNGIRPEPPRRARAEVRAELGLDDRPVGIIVARIVDTQNSAGRR